MFWNKKVNPSTHGVLLDELAQLLSASNLGVKQNGNELIVQHSKLETRVMVEKPEIAETENGLIKAVVTIKTYLPKEILQILSTPESTVTMNAMATLGALTADSGKLFIGSRLTIYEEEDACNIHLPLLLFSTINNADSLLGAMRRTFTSAKLNESDSNWEEKDLEQVERIISTIFVCTTGGLSLTAEFGLREGEISAATGHHRTALWQLRADEPHPEMGGGLFCILQLPHQVSDKSKLTKIIVQLNQMEMSAHDLPPHFGAWCVGRMGDNPAYVSFLPNVLHSVDGIAVNFSIWANARAQWANAMLASLGVVT
jgi:hypothetical protein